MSLGQKILVNSNCHEFVTDKKMHKKDVVGIVTFDLIIII